MLLAPALILITLYAVYFAAYRSYYPAGDDLAIIAASKGAISKWFTEGFSKYFVVYPEWKSALTDFLRPGFDLIMRLNSVLFGRKYSLYFATYYLAQFLLCAVVIATAKRLAVRTRWLYLLGIVVVFSPAFIGEGMDYLAFQFDIWCGLFTLLTVYLIVRRSYALALLSLTAAVFTKETALYAPIAAAVAVYLSTRRKLLAAAMLIPLLAWYCMWKVVFVGTTAGVYVLQGGSRALLIGVGRGILDWPTSVFDERMVRRVLVEHSTLPNVPDLLILLANFTLWILLVAVTLQLLRRCRTSISAPSQDNNLLLGLVVWLWGALAIGVLVAHPSRFGGSIYPLEALVCLAVLHSGAGRSTRRLSILAFCLISTAFCWNALHRLHKPSPPTVHSMKNLIDAVQHNPADVIYVLNSVPSYSNPASISEYAAISGDKVVILSETNGCLTGSATPPVILEQALAVHVISIIPDCALYEFDQVPLNILAEGFHGEAVRGSLATYRFPHGKILNYALGNSKNISEVDLGSEMDLSLSPEPGRSYVILYYDWSSGRFLCAGKWCADGRG